MDEERFLPAPIEQQRGEAHDTDITTNVERTNRRINDWLLRLVGYTADDTRGKG